jgi:ketosteroid isomerase-like protein
MKKAVLIFGLISSIPLKGSSSPQFDLAYNSHSNGCLSPPMVYKCKLLDSSPDSLNNDKSDLMTNQEILSKANIAFRKGDFEAFLTFCTDDTEWVYVGDQTVTGKEKLREYIKTVYQESTFTEEKFIEQGHFLTVLGKIKLKKDGKLMNYSYCDVWEFRDGKIAGLKAFVIAD